MVPVAYHRSSHNQIRLRIKRHDSALRLRRHIAEDTLTYKSTEHAYQASKSLDMNIRRRIKNVTTASEAKSLGRPPDKGGIVILRDDWDKVNRRIMYHINWQKYQYNKDLRALLISTDGHVLIEGNYWHDNYWGICFCRSCSAERARENTKLGDNWLGRILMNIRERIVIQL